ncbi:MAG: ABC transporter ATP-binding protein [Dehalococcoidia bacterium]
MSEPAIIEARNLTKAFGRRVAVNNVNLTVPRGTCFGFLGPNGAGKTTMMRMLLGLARPSSGSAIVRGHDVSKARSAALARVGAIVEEPRFYPYLSGQANLEAWAALWGAQATARIPGLLERVGLGSRGADTVKSYSQGMRQRLGLARALLNDPELLILDEPTNGLDVQGMQEFRLMVREMVEREGRTVFISSHQLHELERIVDSVAIVNQGTVVIEGPMATLIAAGEQGVLVDSDDEPGLRAVAGAFPGVRGIDRRADGSFFVDVSPSRETLVALNRALVAAGIPVAQIHRSQQSLEERYMTITGEGEPVGGKTSAG